MEINGSIERIWLKLKRDPYMSLRKYQWCRSETVRRWAVL